MGTELGADMLRRILWFGAAGTISSAVLILFSGDIRFSSVTLDWKFAGTFFAAAIAAAAMTAESSHASWGTRTVLRYIFATTILAAGVPLALLVAALTDMVLGKTGLFEQYSRTSSFCLPALVAGAFWALCLAVWLRVMLIRWTARWFAQALLVTWLAFALAVAADEISKAVWHYSIFVSVFIAIEQIGSAIFLAIAFHGGPSIAGVQVRSENAAPG
jgi:hypothetical protein